MVSRALGQQPPVESVVDGEKRPADELLAIAEQHWLSLHAKTEESLRRDGITQRWLEQTVSKLNRELTETLGPELAERCKLASRVVGGHRGYALPEGLELYIDKNTAAPASE